MGRCGSVIVVGRLKFISPASMFCKHKSNKLLSFENSDDTSPNSVLFAISMASSMEEYGMIVQLGDSSSLPRNKLLGLNLFV